MAKISGKKLFFPTFSFSLEAVYSDTIEASTSPEGVLQSRNEIFEDSGNFVTSDFRGWLNRQQRREIHAKGNRSQIPWGLSRGSYAVLTFDSVRGVTIVFAFYFYIHLTLFPFAVRNSTKQVPFYFFLLHSNLV